MRSRGVFWWDGWGMGFGAWCVVRFAYLVSDILDARWGGYPGRLKYHVLYYTHHLTM